MWVVAIENMDFLFLIGKKLVKWILVVLKSHWTKFTHSGHPCVSFSTTALTTTAEPARSCSLRCLHHRSHHPTSRLRRSRQKYLLQVLWVALLRLLIQPLPPASLLWLLTLLQRRPYTSRSLRARGRGWMLHHHRAPGKRRDPHRFLPSKSGGISATMWDLRSTASAVFSIRKRAED